MKLHELLAIEGNYKAQYVKTRKDLAEAFSKKRHLFTGKLTTFVPNNPDLPSVTEETTELQTTVQKELEWVVDLWSRSIGASIGIALANTGTTASVEVEGNLNFLSSLPPTALLDLEKRLNEIRAFAEQIPTLDPAKSFKPDLDKPGKVYVSADDVRIRTKKENKVLVLSPATKEHPAQTQLVTEDVPVGKIVTKEWSGMITPAEKSDILGRADILIRAVRAARSRANDTAATIATEQGVKILRYIFYGGPVHEK